MEDSRGGDVADALMRPARAIGWAELDGGEAALVQRCVAGDEEGCAELVDAHRRMVYQLALHLVSDASEAHDLSQEVFLRVFRTLDRFRGQSALRTWIYRIVVNQARNRQRWWRRRRRNDQISLDDHVRAYGDLPERTRANDPHLRLGRKELAGRIAKALDALPFEQRTAIVLREIDGLSYAEIAYSLGVAVGTVKSRLARARELLREELSER